MGRHSRGRDWRPTPALAVVVACIGTLGVVYATVSPRDEVRVPTFTEPVADQIDLAPPPLAALVVPTVAPTTPPPPPTPSVPSSVAVDTAEPVAVTVTRRATPSPTTRVQAVETPSRQPAPDPEPAPEPARQADGDIIAAARAILAEDVPYVWGGKTLSGMDCSGFVWNVLKNAGYDVPYRTSSALKAWAAPVSDPRPGDFAFWPGHVAFFIGDGMIIGSSSSKGGVVESKMWGSPTFGRIP